MQEDFEGIELRPLVGGRLEVDGDTPPPPYSAADPGWRVTYVDFTPKCVDNGGIVSSAKFETFDILVARANDYLRRHPTVCVKNMETTKFAVYNTKKPGTVVDTREATFKDTRSRGGILVNALRVWISPKESAHEQQVGYLNVVPACLNPGGILRRPKFDSLSNTLKKLNKLLEEKPLPGRIITIETVQHHFDQYRKWVEPERCHWALHNDLSTSYLSFFRIYYEAGPQKKIHIGCKDFVPKRLRTFSPYSLKSNFESVDDLLKYAHTWIMSNASCRFLNVHTNYHQIHKGDPKSVKTDVSLTTHYSTPDVVQSLRLWYTENPEELDTEQTRDAADSDSSDLRLKYKTFFPMQLESGGIFQNVIFENMIDTRRRLKDWVLNNDDVNVVCCETVQVKYGHSLPYGDKTVTNTYHSGSFSLNSTWITVLRLCVLARVQSVL